MRRTRRIVSSFPWLQILDDINIKWNLKINKNEFSLKGKIIIGYIFIYKFKDTLISFLPEFL